MYFNKYFVPLKAVNLTSFESNKGTAARWGDSPLHYRPHGRKEAGGPTAEDVRSLLTDERTYLFAAISADEVMGYALAYRFPALYRPGGLAYLYDIEVAEAHRRKGIGRLLIEAVLCHLKADGATEMWLGTDADNEAAQALYSATGGERSDEAFYDFTYHIA